MPRIEVTCSELAAETLVPLLRELQRVGAAGTTCEVEIDDWDGPDKFAFDGDGGARIESVKVDGKPIAGTSEGETMDGEPVEQHKRDWPADLNAKQEGDPWL